MTGPRIPAVESQLHSLQFIADPVVRNALQSVHNTLIARSGAAGETDERYVTLRELKALQRKLRPPEPRPQQIGQQLGNVPTTPGGGVPPPPGTSTGLYVVASTYDGTLPASLILVEHPFPIPVRFPADLIHSKGVLSPSARATATTNIDIQRSTDGGATYASIGTMQFLPPPTKNGYTATFIFPNDVTFQPGDVMRWVAPSVPDVSAGDFGAQLTGSASVFDTGDPLRGMGTVTSVDLSMPAEFTVSGNPIIDGGTLAVTWVNAGVNTVLAGPDSVGAGVPTFRALVAADIPALAYAPDVLTTKGDLLVYDGGAYVRLAVGSNNQVLTADSAQSAGVKWAAGGGTVTSVALTVPSILSVSGSPVTTSGTLAVSLATQTANKVFAGPTSGGAATPTFRALVDADLPAGAGSPLTTKGDLYTFSTVNARLAVGTNGQVLSANSATATGLEWVDASSGSGTVTSVAMTVPTILSVSGTPITTSGTLAVSLATQSANTVFAGPTSGGAATPTFRSLVAADIPSGGGSPLTTKGDIYTFSTVNARLAVGSDGQVLSADSTAATGLKWTSASSGTVTSVALTVPSILSVSGSPVTTSGTLAVTLATQTANTVFAGATSGGAATPAFRALVAADIPVMVASGSSHAAGAVPDPGSTAGSSKFLCENATWATVGAGVGGSVVLITSTNVSGQLTLDCTNIFSSTYDAYVLELINLYPSSNSVTLQLTFSTDGGATWLATNYQYASSSLNTGNTAGSLNSASAAVIQLGTGVSNTSVFGFSGYIRFTDPRNTSFGKGCTYVLLGQSTTASYYRVGMGLNTTLTAIDSVRFNFSAGNISGTVRVYGIAH